ncbi:Gly-Xaa carboxypeptidase [Kwoniella heveanensis CBS 569]|nr:Gly-Xaa carboxypeptidase [Kwoniella heveanensis CBS 569]
MSEKTITPQPHFESTSLPSPVQAQGRGKASRSASTWRPRILLGTIFLLATVVNFGPALSGRFSNSNSEHSPFGNAGSKQGFQEDENWVVEKYGLEELKKYATCPEQPKAIYPNLTWELNDEERKKSVELYAQAVRIPTESFDDNGEPKADPRWAPFYDFQTWLKDSFPLAHEKAKVEYINTLGILATFEGSDPSLKPLLLMSHYDVVPAPSDTFDRWTHPPFSGYNDGKYIWGRGASDDKTLLVAQWEAITHLLELGFQPRRTLILSHGFDEEEVFARKGQGHIAPFLEERYGKDGLLMVIDEGGGTDNFYGTPFALPGMGEKGYMDIVISVGTAGGHSSVPPVHSGIGIMSQLVTALENNPFPTKLTPASPYLTALQCAASHAASFPRKYSKFLKTEGPTSYPHLAKSLSSTSLARKALLGTTTAVDVVNGGVKVNALPELVTAKVNFRIDFSESIASTQHHIAKLAEKIAEDNGLLFSGFEGREKEELGGRYVHVELLGEALEPAPRTPAEGGVWDLFAGTVKGAIPGPDGKEIIVSPYASTGNTDCKMYYNLTKNVYRFMGSQAGSGGGAHTVDEKASIEGHYQILRWVHAIIQTADAYTGEE